MTILSPTAIDSNQASDNPEYLIRQYHKTGDHTFLHKYYERPEYGHIYQKPKPKWVRKFRIVIDLINPQPGQKVLDVGCSTQMLRPLVEERRAIYRGLDIAAHFNPDFLTDAQTLEGVDESFDWAVASDVFEHLADPDESMRRLTSITERLIFIVPNLYNLERFTFLPRSSGDRHVIRRNPKTWLKHCEMSGWNIESVRGFFFVPSISFYPSLPLRAIEKFVLRTKPFIWLNDHLWDRWAEGVLKYLGQELIVVARRKQSSDS